MKLKYRKVIARFRTVYKIAKMIAYNSGYFYYKRTYIKNKYKEKFKQIYGQKKGKRCFIIGNGPSLEIEDLEKLKDEDCFAANEIYKLYDRTDWRPTYYVVMDRYTKASPEIIENMRCEIMYLGDYYCRYNKVLRQDIICLHQHVSFNSDTYIVSDDISRSVTISPTVSLVSMQIAAYMGYSEIYLLGFDHSYSYEFDNDGSVISTGIKDAHFFKDDVAEDIIADVNGMTKAYMSFRVFANRKGIVVQNVTRGGKLEVFERTSIDSLFK